MNPKRTSFIIRCTAQDAAAIRAQAKAQHRSVSGYLLYMLERSLWVEEKFAAGLAGSTLERAAPITNVPSEGAKAAIHLCCSVEELDRIQAAALRRRMSINAFILFSVRRYWRAIENVRQGTQRVEASRKAELLTGDEAKPDRQP